MRIILDKIVTAIIDLLYPEYPSCPICEREFSEGQLGLCSKCIGEIIFIEENYCIKCGKKMLDREKLCFDCQNREHFFDQVRAVGVYEKGLKEYIKLFKYSKYRTLAQPLGDLMAIYVERFYNTKEIDLISYIPIHKSRLEDRGFNQAYLLAKQVAANFKIPVKAVLFRNEDTVKQSKLTKQQRLENLKGQFRIEMAQLVREKNILLVDDIYTTGMTVDQASRILKKSGALKVNAIVLSTGKDIDII